MGKLPVPGRPTNLDLKTERSCHPGKQSEITYIFFENVAAKIFTSEVQL